MHHASVSILEKNYENHATEFNEAVKTRSALFCSVQRISLVDMWETVKFVKQRLIIGIFLKRMPWLCITGSFKIFSHQVQRPSKERLYWCQSIRKNFANLSLKSLVWHSAVRRVVVSVLLTK